MCVMRLCDGEICETGAFGGLEEITADNIDYLRSSFEGVAQDNWERLSSSERMDVLRLWEARTAELSDKVPRTVVCEKMEGDSFADADIVHINAEHIGNARCRESVLKPFSFRGRSLSFRGSFEDVMRRNDAVMKDAKDFIRKYDKSIDERLDKEVRRAMEERESLNRWVERQLTRPIGELEREARRAEIELEIEKTHAHRMEILQDQSDLEIASLKGQTMDQFYAEKMGYRQVYHNINGFYAGNPNLFTKDGNLYELLPSGNLYQKFDTGYLASNPSANVRKK